MKRLLPTLAVLAVLTGCNGDPVDPPPAAPAAVEAPAAAVSASGRRTVRLSRAQQAEIRLAFEIASAQSQPQTLRAPGRVTVNENRTWRVGALTSGVVSYTYKNAGDRVQKGDVLARMHSHEIHEGRAAYRVAQAEVDRKQADLAYAQKVLDRQRRLYELKAGSLAQVEQAEIEFKNAQSALRNAETELERTRQHLEHFLRISAEDVHEEKRHEGGYHPEPEEDLIPIYAPAAGTVLSRTVSAGSAVEPATGELFVISDLSDVWVIAAVNEADLAVVRNGMAAKVITRAYPETSFSGRVTRIEEKLDPETRTVAVRVTVPNRGQRLKPEMFAEVILEGAKSGEAIFLPEEAVQELDSQTVVFVRRSPEEFEAVPVSAGAVLDGRVRIAHGVEQGQEVVTRGSFLLKSQLLKATFGEE